MWLKKINLETIVENFFEKLCRSCRRSRSTIPCSHQDHSPHLKRYMKTHSAVGICVVSCCHRYCCGRRRRRCRCRCPAPVQCNFWNDNFFDVTFQSFFLLFWNVQYIELLWHVVIGSDHLQCQEWTEIVVWCWQNLWLIFLIEWNVVVVFCFVPC